MILFNFFMCLARRRFSAKISYVPFLTDNFVAWRKIFFFFKENQPFLFHLVLYSSKWQDAHLCGMLKFSPKRFCDMISCNVLRFLLSI